MVDYGWPFYLDLLLDTLNLSTEDLHKCFDSESRKIKIFKYLNKAFSKKLRIASLEIKRCIFFFSTNANAKSRNDTQMQAGLLSYEV